MGKKTLIELRERLIILKEEQNKNIFIPYDTNTGVALDGLNYESLEEITNKTNTYTAIKIIQLELENLILNLSEEGIYPDEIEVHISPDIYVSKKYNLLREIDLLRTERSNEDLTDEDMIKDIVPFNYMITPYVNGKPLENKVISKDAIIPIIYNDFVKLMEFDGYSITPKTFEDFYTSCGAKFTIQLIEENKYTI